MLALLLCMLCIKKELEPVSVEQAAGTVVKPVEASSQPGHDPLYRPVSAAGMTAAEEDEEADAVRRSNRQRRPPVHLSEDDYPASDAEPASDADKAARIARKLHAHPGASNWLGALSDDSDQSCYGRSSAQCSLSRSS